jgi:hypothetical protein
MLGAACRVLFEIAGIADALIGWRAPNRRPGVGYLVCSRDGVESCRPVNGELPRHRQWRSRQGAPGTFVTSVWIFYAKNKCMLSIGGS